MKDMFDGFTVNVFFDEKRTNPMAIKSESVWTADDLSYTVVVYNYNPCEQMASSVLKYSERQFSPLLADNIRFSTPDCLRTMDVSPGSELTKDELEVTRQEFIPIERPSELHNELARSLNADPYELMTRFKLTLWYDSCWIYSTASNFVPVDSISSDYDCITRIDNPHKFALLVGKNFAEKTYSNPGFAEEHLEYRPHGKDFETYKQLRESNEWIGEKIIVVKHGFVQYTYGEPDTDDAPVPFIKRSDYREQQEYRFTVQVLGFSMKKPYVDIKTTSDMKCLMSLVDNDSSELLVNENVSPQNMVERLWGERTENIQLQCRDGDDWVKVCEYDLNTHHPIDIDTRVSRNYLNFDLLDIDVSQIRNTGQLQVALRDGSLVRDEVTDLFRLVVKCAGYPLCAVPINMIRDSA